MNVRIYEAWSMTWMTFLHNMWVCLSIVAVVKNASSFLALNFFQLLPFNVFFLTRSMSSISSDFISFIVVGLLWGVTNPFLRRGMIVNAKNEEDPQEPSSWFKSLSSYLNFSVWFPYIVNQSGSLVYYRLLGKTDLSLAVPVCNALALAFGSITAWFLGEKVNKPYHALLGGVLVSFGVILCAISVDGWVRLKLGLSFWNRPFRV